MRPLMGRVLSRREILEAWDVQSCFDARLQRRGVLNLYARQAGRIC